MTYEKAMKIKPLNLTVITDWQPEGPHGKGAQKYQVASPSANIAICDCWAEEDAQLIADALNKQGVRVLSGEKK